MGTADLFVVSATVAIVYSPDNLVEVELDPLNISDKWEKGVRKPTCCCSLTFICLLVKILMHFDILELWVT